LSNWEGGKSENIEHFSFQFDPLTIFKLHFTILKQHVTNCPEAKSTQFGQFTAPK